MYSESYYREGFDGFMKKYHKAADLEADLKLLTSGYSLPEEAMQIVTKMMAQKVADNCKKGLIEKKQVINKLNSGEASLGLISARQDAERRHELVEEFEFTCLCLGDFKRRYNLQ